MCYAALRYLADFKAGWSFGEGQVTGISFFHYTGDSCLTGIITCQIQKENPDHTLSESDFLFDSHVVRPSLPAIWMVAISHDMLFALEVM